MSSVYSSGNRTRAAAETSATVRTFIKTADDGSQYVDRPGLTQYLRQQFDGVASTDALPGGTNTGVLGSSLGALDTAQFVAALARIVDKENWVNKTGWPGSSNTGQTASSKVSIASEKMAVVKVASQAISDYFAGILDGDSLVLLAKNYLTGGAVTFPPVQTRVIETRTYIQTFVTDWDEESQPSDPSDLIDLDQDDSVTVNLALPTPGRHITRWRLYRSNSSNTGAAFQFVSEGPAGQTQYEDKQKAEQLEEVCPTTTWAEPPSNLRGLVGMPNGIMAGFFDNTVAFCQPYQGYAWPVEYQVTTEHPIVGLGVFDQTVFVGTRGQPYLITGADAASMSAQKLNSNQSCVSARSIVGVQGGALFASADGICMASLNGVAVITVKHFTREDWQKLNPASIFAVEHDQTYYFWWQAGTTRGCYGLHIATGKLIAMDIDATAAFVDRVVDTLYIAEGSAIKAAFSSAQRRSGSWKGKLARMPRPVGFAWLQVDSDFSAPVTVRVHGDGQLRYTVAVNSTDPVRVPQGRFLEYQVEVITQARVTRIRLASNTQELQTT